MWSFVEPRIRNHLAKLNHKSTAATFSGRVISASTATGYGKTHAAELAAMLDSSMA
jgi:2-oxoglutarate dehydrogenase complex dehydrogenase (E1) component-like enzyme